MWDTDRLRHCRRRHRRGFWAPREAGAALEDARQHRPNNSRSSFSTRPLTPSGTARWRCGDETKARGWMNAPRDIFGGRSPQDLVATGDPAEQRHVLEILIRIDYGVFS